jgi:hypothetical protein
MKSITDNPAIPKDLKAKRYRQHLNRFLLTKRKLDDQPLAPKVDELLNNKPEETKKKKKGSRGRRSSMQR